MVYTIYIFIHIEIDIYIYIILVHLPAGDAWKKPLWINIELHRQEPIASFPPKQKNRPSNRFNG